MFMVPPTRERSIPIIPRLFVLEVALKSPMILLTQVKLVPPPPIIPVTTLAAPLNEELLMLPILL